MATHVPQGAFKTTVTEKLTLANLQRLDRRNALATLGAALLITLCLFWMLFHLGGDASTRYFSDIVYVVAAWLGGILACATAYRMHRGHLRLETSHQLAWLLVGLAMFFDGLGGAYYASLDVLGQVIATPSFADIGYTLYYPLIFAGFLLFPAKPYPPGFRVRGAIEALTVTLCILAVSWFAVIGPSYVAQKNQVPLAALLTSLSYPFWDILLIFAMALLIWRRTERLLHPSLLLCSAGLLAYIWADTSYAYFTSLGTYTSGTFFIDPFWPLGSLLIGLSALYQYAAVARHVVLNATFLAPGAARSSSAQFNHPERSQRRFISLHSSLFYLLLAVLVLLVLYSSTTQQHDITPFLVILISIVGVLVIVRYLLLFQEKEILRRERDWRREEAKRLHLLTAQLTEILELYPLLERIVTIAAAKLGFDAAVLLLLEDDIDPAMTESMLLVYTATASSAKALTWRLQVPPSSPVLSGREIGVNWTRQSLLIPSEILTWHQGQQLTTTLFLPLTYHGKILGSLGLSNRSTPHFSEHDYSLARTYAEQAANIIEHASLYQATLAQQTFAKALTTIARRLNAATVAPADIQQLICTEGMKALRADYVLLYVPGPARQLVPLAVSVSASEPPTTLNEWPVIHQHEQEALALNSRKPLLMPLDQHSWSRQEALSTLPNLSAPPSLAGMHLLSPTTAEQGRLPVPALCKKLARRLVHTIMFAPLIAQEQPLGLLILARCEPFSTTQKRSFALTDVPNVQDFAEQAAVAFANAQSYQRLQAAHQGLQALDRLKDQFIMTASHELRTPLTTVQGYLELMAQYGDQVSSNQRQQFLDKAQHSCNELTVLLANVMDASRFTMDAGGDVAHLERVSVQEAVDHAVEFVEPQVRREQREVQLDIPAPLAVYADPAQLCQVLLNISTNALKYSPPRTPLKFAARRVNQERVVLSVSDRGKGIAPQDQGRLFQRFVRLDRDINSAVRGTGLGLYIVRRLIEAMGGKTWVESSGIPGEGSTFYIELPSAQ